MIKKKNDFFWEETKKTMDELVNYQKKRLLQEGRKKIPYLTPEDVLQPNDYKELELDPEFRYEEGILAGILTVQTALFAKKIETIVET